MSRTLSLEVLSRIEGSLEMKVDIDKKTIVDAKISGVMFRGFENLLKGHEPGDALVYTPRICGLCSISHSITAALALASISEPLTIPRNGYLARNILHAVEIAMSHITQFYVYFMPDLINERYSKFKNYSLIEERFSHLGGKSFAITMAERKRFLEIIGLVGGKWPHTLAVQPGGFTNSLTSSEIFRIQGILKQFTSIIENQLYGMPIDDFLNIKSVTDFEEAYGEYNQSPISDICLFLNFTKGAGFLSMGKGPGRFLSGGCYAEDNKKKYMKPGYWDGKYYEFNPDNITESTSHSFFRGEKEVLKPTSGSSDPDLTKKNAYSWAKAPRYNDKVVEVGALARSIINDNNLMTEYFSKYGSTVFTRILARLHETAELLKIIEKWIRELNSSKSFNQKHTLIEDGAGIGFNDAARGFLGHWISVKKGKITNYQVISPTTWNASPKDEKDRHGAIESSLINTVVKDEDSLLEAEHIIRSYDPCLVCTVH